MNKFVARISKSILPRRTRLVCSLLVVSLTIPFSVRSGKSQSTEADSSTDSRSNSNAIVEDYSQKYLEKLDEWRAIIKTLLIKQNEYMLSDSATASRLRVQWFKDLERGKVIRRELREIGLKAYEQAPNTDRDLANLLIDFAVEADTQFDYGTSYQISKVMLDAGCPVPELHRLYGLAAFGTNRFDESEPALKRAVELGVATELSQLEIEALEKAKTLWAEEALIREKEAVDGDLPRVELETTKGNIVIELFENEAPETVSNFITLVEQGFYKDTKFSYVEKQIAQGGDPSGDRRGNCGYQIHGEHKLPNHRNHFYGSVGMARDQKGGDDTASSQFYITFAPIIEFNEKFTVFGRVVSGMEVARSLNLVSLEEFDTRKMDSIISAKVLRKRNHSYAPIKVTR